MIANHLNCLHYLEHQITILSAYNCTLWNIDSNAEPNNHSIRFHPSQQLLLLALKSRAEYCILTNVHVCTLFPGLFVDGNVAILPFSFVLLQSNGMGVLLRNLHAFQHSTSARSDIMSSLSSLSSSSMS